MTISGDRDDPELLFNEGGADCPPIASDGASDFESIPSSMKGGRTAPR